ncbi:DUF825 domain-containing protein, partial [Mycobacterium tuberculosis]|nr:DUF825 domain-containing protein [Mycobacterium tuberculosis]
DDPVRILVTGGVSSGKSTHDGYLVRTHLLFVSRVYSELQTEFEKVKSLMIPSYVMLGMPWIVVVARGWADGVVELRDRLSG